MSNYKVSLVLIVYNTEACIEECLESVVSQSFDDLEIVIVNNDSNEETCAILDRYVNKYKNIVYVKNKKNVGGATAGNKGIKKAKGEYVFLMDSDDVLPKDAISLLYNEAVAKKADVVIGRGMSIIGGNIYNNKFKADLITWAKPVTVDDIRKAPYLAMAPFYWGKLYRRKMLTSNDIFMVDGMINADRYFNTKALKHAKKISVITDVCYYWRRHMAGSEAKSVTQKKAKVKGFTDRMESVKMTDELFHEPGYEEMYDYIRKAGLLRLLIMSKKLKENDNFSDTYLEMMTNYLETIPEHLFLDSDLFRSDQKVLLYLMKHQRYAEVFDLIKNKEDNSFDIVDDRVIYHYDGIKDIPQAACSQLRVKVDQCTGKLKKTLLGGKRIIISIPLWKNAKLCVTDAFLMDENKIERQKLKVGKAWKIGDVLKCSVKLSEDLEDVIEEDHIYYISIVYVVGQMKVERIRVTDEEDQLICLQKKEQQIVINSMSNEEYSFDEKNRIVKIR